MAKRKTAPATAAKRVAIYLRVSTVGQTTTNQRRELEAVAKRPGEFSRTMAYPVPAWP